MSYYEEAKKQNELDKEKYPSAEKLLNREKKIKIFIISILTTVLILTLFVVIIKQIQPKPKTPQELANEARAKIIAELQSSPPIKLTKEERDAIIKDLNASPKINLTEEQRNKILQDLNKN